MSSPNNKPVSSSRLFGFFSGAILTALSVNNSTHEYSLVCDVNNADSSVSSVHQSGVSDCTQLALNTLLICDIATLILDSSEAIITTVKAV